MLGFCMLSTRYFSYLFIFHRSSAGITLFLFSLTLNEAKIIYTLVLKKEKKKKKKKGNDNLVSHYEVSSCDALL